MSFVRIIDEKNPIEVYNSVVKAFKTHKLTPEFCMGVLSRTNVPAVMKEMLEKIGRLPVEEQLKYKEVVLSIFDRRQTSKKVKNEALEMAKNKGFEEDLNRVIKETGKGGYSAKFGVKDEVYIIGENGSSYNVKRDLWSGGEYLDYTDFNFSNYKIVIFEGKVKTIKFCRNYFLLLHNDSLKGFIDLSNMDNVDLSGCDLSDVLNIKFKDKSVVNLRDAKKLPKDLDVSMCDEVNLRKCDLKNFNFKFKEGAKVVLTWAWGLPKCLDVSMCGEVKMNNSGIYNVKELRFKNKRQMRDSEVKIPESWKGKIIYTEDLWGRFKHWCKEK